MSGSERTKRDMAYCCFVAPGAAALVTAAASAVPMSTGSAGALGFLVLIPLALLALVGAAVGVALSIVLWRDGVLPLLSVLTILMVAELVSEAGSAQFYNLTGAVYGVLAFVLVGSWFFWRRPRANPQ